MSELFPELYLDEDVNVLVADLVRARGYSAVTTVEAGQRQNDDAAQLAYAVAQNMTLLTHNRADFEILAKHYFEAGQSHSGIIIAVRRSPYEIARRLLVLLNAASVHEMRDQVRYI